MKLTYIANLRLPTEKAYGIQIAKTGEALAAQGIKVKLVAPFRFSRIKTDFFEYYGIAKSFEFKKIFAPDFYLPGPLDKIAFGVKSFIAAVILDLYALAAGADIYYFRDELPVYLMSFFIRPEKIIFEAHKYSRVRRFWFSRFRKKGIKVMVITGELKKELIEVGFAEKNILVAPDGVDLKEFAVALDQNQAREQVGLPMGKKIVLYAGHLFGWKGASVLLEVARNFQFSIFPPSGDLPQGDNFQKNIEDILFVFVGGTEHDVEEFRKKAANLDNVLILGHQPHKMIPLYLKAADVLVLPNSGRAPISRFYTSPLKLFEYMAAQRPIVASDLPSLREVLNENNAALVSSDDSIALAAGIKKVLLDPVLADRIVQRAYNDVQNYTWSKRAGKILKFTTKKQ